MNFHGSDGTGTTSGSPRRRRDDVHEEAFGHREDQLARLVGRSSAIEVIKKQLVRFAPTNVPMLLLGASGTGKGLAAQIIHEISRRSGPFEAMNCATLSSELAGSQLFGHKRGAFTGAVGQTAGAIERAHLGTLFLDEVTDLPAEVQPALLTVLEDGRFRPLGDSKMRHSDFRVVAATARPIEELVSTGGFRDDLYARLRTCTIRLPDLDDRGSDVLLIAERLLPGLCAEVPRECLRLSPSARGLLLNAEWPGNVRALAGALLHAVLLAEDDIIHEATMKRALVEFFGDKSSMDNLGIPTMSEAEAAGRRKAITRALLACDGNKAAAARMLQVSASKFYRLRKELGIE